jgi:hypothetical protein
MWEVDHALAEHTHFMQIEGGRWKAEYKGFVVMTAEGDTPTMSERQLSRAMDTLLASLIRGGKDPEKRGPDAFITSLMLSDAITVVKNTAKKTAEFKRAKRKPFSSRLENSADGSRAAAEKTSRKRR